MASGVAGTAEQGGVVDRLIAELLAPAVGVPAFREQPQIRGKLEIGERGGEIAPHRRQKIKRQHEAVAAVEVEKVAGLLAEIDRTEVDVAVESQRMEMRIGDRERKSMTSSN